MAFLKRAKDFEGLGEDEILQIGLLLAFINNLQTNKEIDSQSRTLHLKELKRFFDNPKGSRPADRENTEEPHWTNYTRASAIIDPGDVASSFTEKSYKPPELKLKGLFSGLLGSDPKAEQCMRIVGLIEKTKDQKKINELYLTIAPILDKYQEGLKKNNNKIENQIDKDRRDALYERRHHKGSLLELAEKPREKKQLYEDSSEENITKVLEQYKIAYTELELPKREVSVDEKRISESRLSGKSESKLHGEELYLTSPTRSPAVSSRPISRENAKSSKKSNSSTEPEKKRKKEIRPKPPGYISSDDDD